MWDRGVGNTGDDPEVSVGVAWIAKEVLVRKIKIALFVGAVNSR